MELNYFVDILFDLINECDSLESDLRNIFSRKSGLMVEMKDGTVFTLSVSQGENETTENNMIQPRH